MVYITMMGQSYNIIIKSKEKSLHSVEYNSETIKMIIFAVITLSLDKKKWMLYVGGTIHYGIVFFFVLCLKLQFFSNFSCTYCLMDDVVVECDCMPVFWHF